MNLDMYLSTKGVKLRKATADMMDSIYADLLPFVTKNEFPPWLIEKMKPLGINGLHIQGHGSPALSTLETGAVCYELAKRDACVSSFFVAHNCIGLAVIDALGDEE